MTKYSCKKIMYALPRRRVSGIKQTENVLICEMKESGVESVEFFYFGSFSDQDSFIFRLFSRLADLGQFIKQCFRFKPDVIHYNTSFDYRSVLRDMFFAVTSKLLFTKLLLKVHGSDREFLASLNFFWKNIGELCLRASDRVCVGTFVEKQEFLDTFSVDDEKYIVMKNAVNISDFEKNESDEKYFSDRKKELPTILYLSRIIKEKGAFDFLEAIPLVLKDNKANFYFGGFGKDRETLINLIKEKGLQEYVHVLPLLSDEEVKRIYHFCDFYVFPTHCAEGIPISLLNAMVCGKPIITAKFRFSLDYLSEPDNCLFVEKGNSDQLAEKIMYLFEKPELQQQMSENNRKLAHTFAKEGVVMDYLGVYEKL